MFYEVVISTIFYTSSSVYNEEFTLNLDIMQRYLLHYDSIDNRMLEKQQCV
jgi:hypothetical protein